MGIRTCVPRAQDFKLVLYQWRGVLNYLSIYLSTYLSKYIPSLSPSGSSYGSPSLCGSLSLSLYPSIYLPINQSTNLSIYILSLSVPIFPSGFGYVVATCTLEIRFMPRFHLLRNKTDLLLVRRKTPSTGSNTVRVAPH